MNRLLIVGAGGHGKVVQEVAEAMHLFDEIGFADDNAPEAVGKLSDLPALRARYSMAVAGIGNNALRRQLIDTLLRLGYEVPVLVHPTAYRSPTCRLGAGTVLEPMAIVNANTAVGEGCIISVGAIVDHDVVLEPCVHVNAGSIVKAGAKVKAETKLEAGQVVLGYGAPQP